MATKSQKPLGFNSDKELSDFLLANLTDSLKQSIRITVRIMIKQEMENLRKEVNEKLSFNGSYTRSMTSGLGQVSDIAVPRFREKPMAELPLTSTAVFDQEKEKFLKVVAEMHRLGISQRKVAALCENCFGVKVSKNRVGSVHRELAREESLKINSRALSDEFSQIMADGIWVKCKNFGLAEDKKVVLLCVLGIKEDGERRIIGFRQAESEDFESWSSLLEDIKKRGPAGKNLKLLTADDNGGLAKAASYLYPKVPLQICIAHKMRNVITKTRYKNRSIIASDLKPVYQAETREQAVSLMRQFSRKWYVAEEKAVKSLRFNFERTLTYFDFPKDIWKKIRTTNILEREFREVRRRIKVFDNSFDNSQSLMNYGNTIFDYLNNHYPASSIHTKS